MSQINTNAILDASGGTTATVNGFTPTVSNMAGRNRIINGDMRIDQRNAGAAISAATLGGGGYMVDRWTAYFTQSAKFSVQQNAGSVTPPAGFTNYLGFTTAAAYSVTGGDTFFTYQIIEGNNITDLAWGTSNAKAVTVSFWAYSSLTGNFGASITNNGFRSYCFSFNIPVANTWTYVTVSISGDTSGSWPTGNNGGFQLRFNLGSGATFTGTANTWSSSNTVAPTGSVSVVGTSGATFYITGVQLEAGSVATPFEHRQYGQELALCQRYYWRVSETSFFPTWGSGMCSATTTARLYVKHPVNMRARPTYSYGGTVYVVAGSSVGIVSAIGGSNSTLSSATVDLTTTGLPVGNGAISYPASGLTNFVEAGAEL